MHSTLGFATRRAASAMTVAATMEATMEGGVEIMTHPSAVTMAKIAVLQWSGANRRPAQAGTSLSNLPRMSV